MNPYSQLSRQEGRTTGGVGCEEGVDLLREETKVKRLEIEVPIRVRKPPQSGYLLWLPAFP